jgi:hypothetical protein
LSSNEHHEFYRMAVWVLLADGLWLVFGERIWVLYNTAVKPVTADSAFFLDPFLMQGIEHAKGWRLC